MTSALLSSPYAMLQGLQHAATEAGGLEQAATGVEHVGWSMYVMEHVAFHCSVLVPTLC